MTTDGEKLAQKVVVPRLLAENAELRAALAGAEAELVTANDRIATLEGEAMAYEDTIKDIGPVVTERDDLAAKLAAAERALADERERCIKLVCPWCAEGVRVHRGRPFANSSAWVHYPNGREARCDASAIRAALTPAPATPEERHEG